MFSVRIELTRRFLSAFLQSAMHVREVMASLLTGILLGGVAISWLEKIPLGDAIYFACITGLSIGYGDITPQTAWGRIVSVAIGLVGMVLVGIVVAIATHALADVVRSASNRTA
jgi:voltage-gated potassium channel